jgi:hypothetical protein
MNERDDTLAERRGSLKDNGERRLQISRALDLVGDEIRLPFRRRNFRGGGPQQE